MPYVPVPKDLSRVKNKVALNLTKRQLLCFSLAGAVGIPFYLFGRSHIGTDVAALCMIGLMLPFFAVGMYEKDGHPLEKIIFHFVRARFLWPQIRPYKTNNLYAALERQAQLDKEVQAFEQSKKTGQSGKSGSKKAAQNRRA